MNASTKQSKGPPQDVEIPASLSEKDLASLRNHVQLLQIFHHRNKNQHRRSPWWRHFDHFRRETKSFVLEVEGTHEIAAGKKPDTISQKVKGQGRDDKISITNRMQALKVERRRLEERRVKSVAKLRGRSTIWSRVLIARWYRAFSQLTADPQFAVMGLFLIAALSKICGLLGIEPDVDESDEVDVAVSLEESSGMPPGLDQGGLDSQQAVDDTELGVDIGVRIERAPSVDEDTSEKVSGTRPRQTSFSQDKEVPQSADPFPNSQKTKTVAEASTQTGSTLPRRPAQKNRMSSSHAGVGRKDGPTKNKTGVKKAAKKSNAIDDLFSNLF